MPFPQVVILHGWSDNSDSFKPLAKWLKKNGHDTYNLMLGDYVSLRDDVQIEDVAKRMDEVVREKQRSGELQRKFDLIVHKHGRLAGPAMDRNALRGSGAKVPGAQSPHAGSGQFRFEAGA